MTDGDDDEPEVGYGRPPSHSRFRPGKSGNPSGRPKKVHTVATALQAELRAKITVRENGIEQRMPKSSAMAKALVARALKGDVKAFAQIVSLLPDQFKADKGEEAAPISAQEKAVLESFVSRRIHAAMASTAKK